MLERVVIANFRGVRDMEVPLQRVTALLGPNSSGKTTVLHAVRMACALLERAIKSDDAAGVVQKSGVDWISVTEGALLTDGAQQLSLADWQALFVDQGVANNTTAAIHLVFGAADPIQEVECARTRPRPWSPRCPRSHPESHRP
jgi:predicted ATPase